jgi:peptide/nickel transport system permease protein
MIVFILKRLAAAVGVLLALAAFLFILQQLTPTDPVHAMLGANASPARIEAKRQELGYDKPLVQQYANYVVGITHGDLQMSLRTRRPVTTGLSDFLPATLELAFYGVLMAIVLGGALGLLTAARFKGSGALRVVLVALASAPVFLLAVFGILLFYRRLGWLPATGRSSFNDAPKGPTKLLTVDTLIAGRPDMWVDSLKHLVPGVLRRHRPCGRHRAGAGRRW